MSILSGIKKVIPYFKNADGNYEQLSYKTSSQTVDFDDGKTAETKLGAIKGITTSTNVTETGYAADAKTVSEINQSLSGVIKCGDTHQKNDVLFNCQDWDDGLYIIYNTRGAGSVCEFLYKNDSFVTMTNIAPQTHTIDGYNITFQTGTWYASLWAHKII